jgi:glycosyltransferase involved in cell wall biosynthesis
LNSMNSKPLRVCLIASEYPGFGPYGGFGVLTRDIALGLVARGIEVYVGMPRKQDQKPVERVDGVTIVSYPSPIYVGLKDIQKFAGLYRAVDADIYHSQEPSLGTVLAQKAMPDRKHIVTFQDPRELADWRVEWGDNRGLKEQLRFWLRYKWQIVRHMSSLDETFCQAKYIIPKTHRMYGLRTLPSFLPNPLKLTPVTGGKATKPTVCYLGRWDARKRPELLMELAGRFPEVQFIFVGACLNDAARDRKLRTQAESMPNVVLPGWVGAEKRSEILRDSWIMINTSTRECLPVSYLEAAAHKCAILSHCNADDFASSFGFWAERGDIEDYTVGLRRLLDGDTWRERGIKGYEYVVNTHEYERVLDQHVEVYQRLAAE